MVAYAVLHGFLCHVAAAILIASAVHAFIKDGSTDASAPILARCSVIAVLRDTSRMRVSGSQSTVRIHSTVIDALTVNAFRMGTATLFAVRRCIAVFGDAHVQKIFRGCSTVGIGPAIADTSLKGFLSLVMTSTFARASGSVAMLMDASLHELSRTLTASRVAAAFIDAFFVFFIGCMSTAPSTSRYRVGARIADGAYTSV